MGKFFNWDGSLIINNPTIDKQHEELFNRADALVDAISMGKGRDEVAGTIKFLQDYVVEHFGTEEAFMKKVNYPDYAAHKEQHEKFVQEFLGWKETFDKMGVSSSLAFKLQDYVGDWLKNHISKTDMALAKFLREQGVHA